MWHLSFVCCSQEGSSCVLPPFHFSPCLRFHVTDDGCWRTQVGHGIALRDTGALGRSQRHRFLAEVPHPAAAAHRWSEWAFVRCRLRSATWAPRRQALGCEDPWDQVCSVPWDSAAFSVLSGADWKRGLGDLSQQLLCSAGPAVGPGTPLGACWSLSASLNSADKPAGQLMVCGKRAQPSP